MNLSKRAFISGAFPPRIDNVKANNTQDYDTSSAMSNPQTSPVSPPPVPDSTLGGSVRRHHTIAASSRAAHAGSRLIAEEQQGTNEDEVVDQDWVGGVGAVGEKSSNLHRQSSLPTRYTRGTSAINTMSPL